MAVYQIDPIRDPRWEQFLAMHPSASAFHSPGWLEALNLSYGYQPLVMTTTMPGVPLMNGLVTCTVSSWLTGKRSVSLPFSDHCQPLVDDLADFEEILRALQRDLVAENYNYVELRPRVPLFPGSETLTRFAQCESYCFHNLDLRPQLSDLSKAFHKNAIQQPLKRAEREQLKIQEGRSDLILGQFYRLLVMTRRKHRLPPQPLDWFRNLAECMGESLVVRVAYKDDVPIAGILSLKYKKTVVYKYSCSDPNYNNLGGTALLLWRTIQSAKEQGCEELDMGRSESENIGLNTFKERWGAKRTESGYFRYPPPSHALSGENNASDYKTELGHQVVSILPDSFLIWAGKLLYRHMG